VLGDSMEKKNTVDDLIKVKKASFTCFQILKEKMPNFNLFHSKLEDVKPYLPSLNINDQKKIIGNLLNRDITNQAKSLIDNNIKIFNKKNNSSKKTHFFINLGNLLNQHQEQLRENIGISTNKIDKILSDCMEIGAYGGKINGSGFGGTMFALFPDNQDKLKRVIEAQNGIAYIIETSKGVTNN
jgi:galactokinase